MSYFSDKPSSRVLRPPGGGSSNIFCNADEPTILKQSSNMKPTYKSSVFEADPETVVSRQTSHTENTANNIFGSNDDSNNTMATPKKISKTQQSSVFLMPEATSDDVKGKGLNGHRISDVPMFSSIGPEEQKRPCRRPITAPTQMPQGAKAAMYNATAYAVDSGPGVGQIKKVCKGHKPANASLLSTVFAWNEEVEIKPARDYEEGSLKQILFSPPEMPRVQQESEPLHRNPISSVFCQEDIEQIRAECRRHPMSATYHSVVFDNASASGANSDVTSVRGVLSTNNQVLNAKAKRSCSQGEFALSKMSEEIDRASIPIWSADCANCRFTTNKRKKMQKSTIFQEETASCVNPLWSSGHTMTSCSVLPKSDFSANLFRSTLFSPEHTNAQFARPVLNGSEPEMHLGVVVPEDTLSDLPSRRASMKTTPENMSRGDDDSNITL